MFQLAAYPDCTEPYSGPMKDMVYILGAGTEHEQLHRPGDGAAVFKIARTLGVGVGRESPSKFCSQAIEDLLAV